VFVWVMLAWAMVVGATDSDPTILSKNQDLRIQAFLPPTYHIKDTIITSLDQFQEEFVGFMSKVPLLWSSPRTVRHHPVDWSGSKRDLQSARDTPSGPCNSPYGQSVKAKVDPCGPLHLCHVQELHCGGVKVKADNFTVDQAKQQNCTVHKVLCENITSPVPQLPQEGCTIQTAQCPAAAPLPSCYLQELVCKQKLLRFPAVNAIACPSPTIEGLECVDTCAPVETDQMVCVCSLDRMGRTCSQWRPYACNVTLLSPEPQCKHTIFDSDPVCFMYSRKEKVSFNFALHCAFTNTTGIQESLAYDSLFDYWGRRKEEFAISSAQHKFWTLESELCVYDLYRLGNRHGCTNVSLESNQLSSDSPITFPVDFSKFTDNFFAGNRMYFEVGMTKASAFPGRVIKRDRRFIDFTDVHISRSVDDSLSQTAISWIIVAVVCTFICLICSVFTVRQRIAKYKLERRIKKLE